MIVLIIIFVLLLVVMFLGTVVFPKINRRIWLRRLRLKRKEIVDAIDLMGASFDINEVHRDFRRANSTLAKKSLQRGANMPKVWGRYDDFQKSLTLYGGDLLEVRVSDSIGDDDAMDLRAGNVVKSLREKAITVLGEYADEFENEPTDILEVLTTPYKLYRKWAQNVSFLEDLKQQGLRKPTMDRARAFDGDLEGLNISAKKIRRSFVALQEVDKYFEAFYNGNPDAVRPIASKDRDIAHEIILNAGWAWRMNENGRAAEMAHKAENLCKDYIGSLQSVFGTLPN